jgi:CoA-transferase family III
MALTGRPDRRPMGPPAPLVGQLQSLGDVLGVEPLQLLVDRAAHMGLTRHGAISCGGSTRLVRAADGWIAIALAREDDIEAVPAWLELDTPPTDVWPAVEAAAAQKPLDDLEARGVLVGLPVAALRGRAPLARAGLHVDVTHYAMRDTRERPPVVVDLSSLWAGPLCSQLLRRSGARVIKVESAQRPDAARTGSPAFFDLLNTGKQSVVFDLGTTDGRAMVGRLVATADVVIEASRPRALEQLGLIADELMRSASGPDLWISITGHGREGDARRRVAFGDDAAVAGGLVVYDELGPCFCADAIADPLTGIVAAAAAVDLLRNGRERSLVDVAMANVARQFAGPTLDGDKDTLTAAPPRARTATTAAAPLGRDTRAVVEELVVG